MLLAEVAGLSQPRAQLPRARQRMLPGHLGAGACPDLVEYLQGETVECNHTDQQPSSLLCLQRSHFAWSGPGTVCRQRYQAIGPVPINLDTGGGGRTPRAWGRRSGSKCMQTSMSWATSCEHSSGTRSGLSMPRTGISRVQISQNSTPRLQHTMPDVVPHQECPASQGHA